jgi:Fe-S-cluster formation regulator IscX/YfhJ
MGFRFRDAEELGRLLFEVHPEKSPLDVEPRELRRLLEEVGGLEPGSPEPGDGELLEAIWQEWFSHYSATSC